MSKSNKLPGVSFRADRQTYIYTPMIKGRRYFFDLETIDAKKAVAKAQVIKQQLADGAFRELGITPPEEPIDEKCLSQLVQEFNLIYADHTQWGLVRAKTDHIDEFGRRIVGGEDYYGCEVGPAFTDRLRLSRRSSYDMLLCLYRGNAGRAAVRNRRIQAQDDSRSNCPWNVF